MIQVTGQGGAFEIGDTDTGKIHGRNLGKEAAARRLRRLIEMRKAHALGEAVRTVVTQDIARASGGQVG